MEQGSSSYKAQTSHQFGATSCPLCQKKLEGCNPFMNVLYHEMRAIEKDVHISWGWRGKNDQEQFFNEGKSKVRWPNSKHNIIDENKVPQSQAIDIFFLSSPGRARFYSDWAHIIFENLKPETKARIRWGGEFKDYLHFEMKTLKKKA